MVKLTSILAFGLINACSAIPGKHQAPKCGEVNVIFTGFPHNHPLVIKQGYKPTAVLTGLKADAARVIKAGYNLRVAFLGPEEPISKFEKELEGYRWHSAGVGFGLRGAPLPETTIQFEETLVVYRKKAPKAELWFNYSPNTTFWAIQRHHPLPDNCPPGKDLGYKEICDPSVCKPVA